MNLRLFLHDLFRPKAHSMKVVVFENGRIREISTYSPQQLLQLMKSVQALCTVPSESSYWFEVEVVEKKGMFRKHPPILFVNCYRADSVNPVIKRGANIPNLYRKKFLDKPHPIRPEPVGMKEWPANLEVRFSLLH